MQMEAVVLENNEWYKLTMIIQNNDRKTWSSM